jgi:hypothetical protein
MSDIDVTLRLPEDLVEQAQEAGILTYKQIAQLLHAELERLQRVGRYFNTLDQLAAIEPVLTQEEIDAEISAYRREKRNHHFST